MMLRGGGVRRRKRRRQQIKCTQIFLMSEGQQSVALGDKVVSRKKMQMMNVMENERKQLLLMGRTRNGVADCEIESNNDSCQQRRR